MAASKSAPAGSMDQLIRGDRSIFMSSDDSVMLKQIEATHSPDGREIDVKPILQIVEDILSRATMSVESIAPGVQARMENMEDKSNQASVVPKLEALPYPIDRISSEIACKCLSGMGGHQATVSLFSMLSSYSWDAKLVLTLAAFALNYGEFWLLTQIYSSNQLAKSMAILKQVPVIMEHSGRLKPLFEGLNNLIKAMLDLTKCIVEFKELPLMYITQQDTPALSAAMAAIPTGVYWAMRGAVACATQIASLTSMGHENLAFTMEAWDLSTLAYKIKSILDHLKKQVDICSQFIEEKMNIAAYEELQKVFEMTPVDNIEVLKKLIQAKDDQRPLFDGSSKKMVNLEVLRRKIVLLLISGLEISQDELANLADIYNKESRKDATRSDRLYEMVWMPIVDRSSGTGTRPMPNQFERLRSLMPWYSVQDLSLIDRVVVMFIREKWHFRKMPIVVVLDPRGRVVNPNAIHMIRIWGSNAFPFTTSREELLWNQETWRLEFLVNGIDQRILNWIREGKYILLYGGDDTNWVQKLAKTARSIAGAASIRLEMVYLGEDQVIIEDITADNISYTWQNQMIWLFWKRLESMLFSKVQLGRADDHDLMMREIKKLLTYYKDTGGWAVLSKGSEVVLNGHGTTMLPTFVEYNAWKAHVPTKGFDRSIKDYHDTVHRDTFPCSRFEFPITTGMMPESMKCPECHIFMAKNITFLCCHDEVFETITDFD